MAGLGADGLPWGTRPILEELSSGGEFPGTQLRKNPDQSGDRIAGQD